jgi:hypothetical protein
VQGAESRSGRYEIQKNDKRKIGGGCDVLKSAIYYTFCPSDGRGLHDTARQSPPLRTGPHAGKSFLAASSFVPHAIPTSRKLLF